MVSSPARWSSLAPAVPRPDLAEQRLAALLPAGCRGDAGAKRAVLPLSSVASLVVKRRRAHPPPGQGPPGHLGDDGRGQRRASSGRGETLGVDGRARDAAEGGIGVLGREAGVAALLFGFLEGRRGRSRGGGRGRGGGGLEGVGEAAAACFFFVGWGEGARARGSALECVLRRLLASASSALGF